MSQSPPIPRVLLMRKRPSSVKKPLYFRCRRLLAHFGTGLMLSKALPIMRWSSSGMMKL
jgi:hypothetical protein